MADAPNYGNAPVCVMCGDPLDEEDVSTEAFEETGELMCTECWSDHWAEVGDAKPAQ